MLRFIIVKLQGFWPLGNNNNNNNIIGLFLLLYEDFVKDDILACVET